MTINIQNTPINARFCAPNLFVPFLPPPWCNLPLNEILLHSRCGRLPTHMWQVVGGERVPLFARDEIIQFFANNYEPKYLRALLKSGFDVESGSGVKPRREHYVPQPTKRRRKAQKSTKVVTLRKVGE